MRPSRSMIPTRHGMQSASVGSPIKPSFPTRPMPRGIGRVGNDGFIGEPTDADCIPCLVGIMDLLGLIQRWKLVRMLDVNVSSTDKNEAPGITFLGIAGAQLVHSGRPGRWATAIGCVRVGDLHGEEAGPGPGGKLAAAGGLRGLR